MRENNRKEEEETSSFGSAERERIEKAAQLEGVPFDDALKLRKGFRYLY